MQPQPISKEDFNAALQQEAEAQGCKVGLAQGAFIVEREGKKAPGGCWEVLHVEELSACCFTVKAMLVACPPLLAGGGDSTADEQSEHHAPPLPCVAVIVMLVAAACAAELHFRL